MSEPKKTPDEIACGLECIRTNAERVCVKPEKGQCPRCEQLVGETLEFIQRLETDNAEKNKRIAELEKKLAAVKRERDTAVRSLGWSRYCVNCKHSSVSGHKEPCKSCVNDGVTKKTNWEWRGVCPENTEVQEDAAE